MAGRSACPRRSAAAKRDRLIAARLSGDPDRIQRAEMRSERNRLRDLWRRDPRAPGRTIVLVPADEATCRHGQRSETFGSISWTVIFRRSRMRSDGYGRDVARPGQRRRPHRQACAAAQPDCGGEP